jgi:hypothetical protein
MATRESRNHSSTARDIAEPLANRTQQICSPKSSSHKPSDCSPLEHDLFGIML